MTIGAAVDREVYSRVVDAVRAQHFSLELELDGADAEIFTRDENDGSVFSVGTLRELVDTVVRALPADSLHS